MTLQQQKTLQALHQRTGFRTTTENSQLWKMAKYENLVTAGCEAGYHTTLITPQPSGSGESSWRKNSQTMFGLKFSQRHDIQPSYGSNPNHNTGVLLTWVVKDLLESEPIYTTTPCVCALNHMYFICLLAYANKTLPYTVMSAIHMRWFPSPPLLV